MRLRELRDVLGQDVVDLAVGGPDQAEVGVAVEHAEQEVGIAPLADGQEPDHLAVTGLDGLARRGDRPERGPFAHDDLVAGQGGQHGVTREGLGDVGDGLPGAGQLRRDEVLEPVGQVELTGPRRGPAGTDLEDEDGSGFRRGVVPDELLGPVLDPLDHLFRDRLGDREESPGDHRGRA